MNIERWKGEIDHVRLNEPSTFALGLMNEHGKSVSMSSLLIYQFCRRKHMEQQTISSFDLLQHIDNMVKRA